MPFHQLVRVDPLLHKHYVQDGPGSIDDVIPQVLGRPPPPARLPIVDISQWVELSLMPVVLCSKFPDKAGELFAYQASIVRADRNYEGKVVDRRQALARRDLNWLVTLYNDAFTGRARPIAGQPRGT